MRRLAAKFGIRSDFDRWHVYPLPTDVELRFVWMRANEYQMLTLPTKYLAHFYASDLTNFDRLMLNL